MTKNKTRCPNLKYAIITSLLVSLSHIVWGSVYGKNVNDSIPRPVYDYPIFSLDPKDFYNQLDEENPEMKVIKAIAQKQNYAGAGEALYDYYVKNKASTQKILGITPVERDKSKRQPDGERLLKRTYSYQGVTYTFENDIDWLYNPTGKNGLELNNEWVVNTVRFRAMPLLAKAYRETGDERFAKELVYLLCDFMEKFPVPLNDNHSGEIPTEFDYLMYSKLSVSARLRHTMIALFSVIDSPNLNAKSFVSIMQGIYNHMLRMEKYPYLRYHNMGVADARVLLQVSLCLPEFSKSKVWTDWALERGLDQMKGVVYPDGVETELCPSYHQGVMGTFSSFMLMANDAGKEVPVEFRERLKKMAAFVVNVSRPDGTVPAFNEMRQRSGNSEGVRKSIRSVARAIGDADVLQWYGSNGRQGVKPDYTSVSFDWAGYYAMRSGWGKNDNYMVIKAGPYGTAHQQEDKLSFELAANGELFLIDPGFYIYNRTSVWRKYYRSSLAHNTVIPNGLSQLRHGRRELYENKVPNDAMWISNEKFDFLSAVYDNGYADFTHVGVSVPDALQAFTHQRDILFVKPGLWLMIDWLGSANSEENLYEALFQSEHPVTVSDNRLTIQGKKSNLYILPIPQGKNGLQSSVVKGQIDPVRRGWIYKVDESENKPIYTGTVGHQAIGNTVQAYFLVPDNGNSASAYEVKTFNVAGGIGGQLIGPDGVSLTFVAQQHPGKEITANGLKTTARLCFYNGKETFEVQ